MTTNGQDSSRKNHLHYRHTEYTPGHSYEQKFDTQFGGLCRVTPISIPGLGHDPHIECRFRYGLRLDLSPEEVVELLRQLPEALAKLPYLPELNDAVAEDE